MEGKYLMKVKLLFTVVLIILLIGCDSNSETGAAESKDYYVLNEEFQEIGNILGNQDIVILGESTHWSADITEKKSSL